MKKTCAIAIFCLLVSVQLHAKQANTVFGEVMPIETLNRYGKGLMAVAPGIVWTTDTTAATFGHKGTRCRTKQT